MTRRLPLSRTYVGHGGAVTEAVLREPTGGLFLDHGEPHEVQRTVDGEPVVLENREVIRAYVEACTSFPGEDDPLVILRQLSLADIRAVKEGVLGFFAVAKGSSVSSPSSPSAPAGNPTPSSD